MLLIQNGLVFTMETDEERYVDLLIDKQKIIRIAKKNNTHGTYENY